MNVSERFFEKTSIIERLIALILLVIFFPTLVLLFIISFIDTRKFPIFIQERGLTLTKYRFKLIKLRTINDRAFNDDQKNNLDRSILRKPNYIVGISTIGKILRKTGLDELPQLINILLGQMKFIGPRALSIDDLQKIKNSFPELYDRRNKLNSKPGIIGLWQVSKDFECSVENLIELDEEHEKKKSFIFNLKILLKAFEIILVGYHVDSIVNEKKLEIYPAIIYVSIISMGILLLIMII